jgi:hypothetical protein
VGEGKTSRAGALKSGQGLEIEGLSVKTINLYNCRILYIIELLMYCY